MLVKNDTGADVIVDAAPEGVECYSTICVFSGGSYIGDSNVEKLIASGKLERVGDVVQVPMPKPVPVPEAAVEPVPEPAKARFSKKGGDE